jgi:hypothetical protein
LRAGSGELPQRPGAGARSVPGWPRLVAYFCSKDNCGNSEYWLDANLNGGGQDATGGDITAPAPGATC